MEKENMNYKLSVCIPTYNRRECLNELLDSITSQSDISSPIEICISDDASTDDTQEFISNYQKKYPYIVYHRFPSNLGLDSNILSSVSLAHGDYCWLMGNDDILEQGAVNHILNLIKEHRDVSIFNLNGYQYDSQLKVRLYDRVKKGQAKSKLKSDQFFNNMEDILSLFGDSIGFLGDNVFKRTLWNDIVNSSDLSMFNGTAYMHIAVLLKIIQKQPNLFYVHHHCMGFRGGNDGFLEILGQFRRLKLDVLGYNCIAKELFPNKSKLYNIWMTQIIKLHIKSRVLVFKSSNKNSHLMADVASLTYKHFGGLLAFWIYIFPLLIIPRNVYLILRSIYKLIR